LARRVAGRLNTLPCQSVYDDDDISLLVKTTNDSASEVTTLWRYTNLLIIIIIIIVTNVNVEKRIRKKENAEKRVIH